jgi:ribose 5-phosphate isomerase A
MDREQLKKIAAERAVEEVEPGMIVGLGSGSTVYYALLKLGEMVRDGFEIVGVPTSSGTEKIAREQEIPLATLEEHSEIDLTIDGADEVDPQLNLIKGGGAALLREKIVAHASKRIIIVVDESKLSDVLGTNFPLPVEIVQFGWNATQRAVNRLCGRSTVRRSGDSKRVTDNGNYILDCRFAQIPNPAETELQLNNIPGVVENGLFVNRVDKVIIGTPSGIQTKEKGA